MPIHRCIVHGCFHATAAEFSSCDRDIYSVGFCKESLSTRDLNHCDILVSDDSLIVKEGKKLWLLRDTQPSHFHWRWTGSHVHTHFLHACSFLCGVKSQHFSPGRGFEISILLFRTLRRLSETQRGWWFAWRHKSRTKQVLWLLVRSPFPLEYLLLKCLKMPWALLKGWLRPVVLAAPMDLALPVVLTGVTKLSSKTKVLHGAVYLELYLSE